MYLLLEDYSILVGLTKDINISSITHNTVYTDDEIENNLGNIQLISRYRNNELIFDKTLLKPFNHPFLQLVHSIPDTNPENGIPEIPGDGESIASILIQMKTGNIYSFINIGEKPWEFIEYKVDNCKTITDNTYSGLVLNLNITRGSLNTKQIILDSNSQGSFKVKSVNETCIGDNAARITITCPDIPELMTEMKIEFAPVDF